MSARAGAADTNENNLRTKAVRLLFSFAVLALAACTGGFETEPLVEYSTEVVVGGGGPHRVTRYLGTGVYLLEIRERDIDLRIAVDAGPVHTQLADSFLRHGLHRMVLRLDEPSRLVVALESVDVRNWKGAAAVRILRWPRGAADGPPDQRLLGFEALGQASSLVAQGTPQAARAAIEHLRTAERHFQVERDAQSLAETEYQRGYVELTLLFDSDTTRRTAQAALTHFRTAGDEAGAQRAAVLLALGEFGSAAQMGPDVPRTRQRALLDAAAQRTADAQAWFDAHDLRSDSLLALGTAQLRNQVLGRIGDSAATFETIRLRARARGDHYFEASATRHLGAIAQRKGDLVRAAALYESVLPLIEHDRNPELYASLTSNLGNVLIALGEFDRALVLHTEALQLFRARGNESQMARELAALAAIQFRSGDLERSLAAIESVLPLLARADDPLGESAAMRLAGNAAAELGRHAEALAYLRAAERADPNGVNADRTRVLIAGELRALGDLRAAEEIIARVLPTPDLSIRADALVERALQRQLRHRASEAIADLRAADATFAALQLDFKRIDTSSALALALLETGDVAGASAAADVAVAMERQIRARTANPEMRARFLAATYAPYEARIEADLATAPQDPAAAWRAFRTAEAIRARSLGDRIAQPDGPARARRDARIGELRASLTSLKLDLEARSQRSDGTTDDMLAMRRRIDEMQARLDARLLQVGAVLASDGPGISASRAEVQSTLPANTAVLAYFVGDRRSHGWLLTRAGLRHTVLPGRRALQILVREFIERLQSDPEAAFEPRFAPLLGELLNGVPPGRLVVLADGPLNGLPFAALPVPHSRSRQLLVDRFVITTAPSLALALRPPEADAGVNVAVVSDPVYTPDDRRLTAAVSDSSRYRGIDDEIGSVARLPYSAVEARAVKRAFAGAQVIELAGFDATARRVIELPARNLHVLHFATHAVVHQREPGRSALLLSEFAPDGTPLSADRLTADDIADSGLRADIVVLSGCATGAGDELRGEGVLGLTYGFLANGSNAVVASLWPVEDALTARFMERFYAAFRATGRAADALRIAQLRTRDLDGTAVWSSFVIRAHGMQ